MKIELKIAYVNWTIFEIYQVWLYPTNIIILDATPSGIAGYFNERMKKYETN